MVKQARAQERRGNCVWQRMETLQRSHRSSQLQQQIVQVLPKDRGDGNAPRPTQGSTTPQALASERKRLEPGMANTGGLIPNSREAVAPTAPASLELTV